MTSTHRNIILGLLAVVVVYPYLRGTSSGIPAGGGQAAPSGQAVACAEARCLDTRAIGWISRGKDAVRAKLRDPASAEFRAVYFYPGAGDRPPVSCGEVNATNGFGGRGGFERYVSGGSADVTFLESQVADFAVAWARFCSP